MKRRDFMKRLSVIVPAGVMGVLFMSEKPEAKAETGKRQIQDTCSGCGSRMTAITTGNGDFCESMHESFLESHAKCRR